MTGLPADPPDATERPPSDPPDTQPPHPALTEEASSLPTQRPDVTAPKPFAGLLAEAGVSPTARASLPAAPAPAAGSSSIVTLSAPPPAARAGTPPSPMFVPEDAPTLLGGIADAQPGRQLGAYKILGELGSGGMAVVYKAVQPALDRLVAIKELRPELVADRQITARFEREATSLATLQHGNIVHIYDFIREPDGAYIVMEYVEGVDLFDLLHDVGRMPPDVGATVALQMAEGLEYAHYRGIIHRDVKPSNILISKSGEVKIMDFGIARDPGRSDLTQIGMALGTPAYMAPEQIRGDKTDFRADVFAMGIVLYEMLTGHKPWGDDSNGTTIARKILAQEPTPPTQHVPDLPAELVRIMGICLAKDPDRRFRSTHDLRRALAAYLAREVSIDARQRLVVFLRNRRLITDGEASSFVHSSVMHDGVLRRRDLGLPTIPAQAMVRPLAIAHGLGLIALAGAAVLAAHAARAGWVSPMPAARPEVELRKPAAAAVTPAPDRPARTEGAATDRAETERRATRKKPRGD